MIILIRRGKKVQIKQPSLETAGVAVIGSIVIATTTVIWSLN